MQHPNHQQVLMMQLRVFTQIQKENQFFIPIPIHISNMIIYHLFKSNFVTLCHIGINFNFAGGVNQINLMKFVVHID